MSRGYSNKLTPVEKRVLAWVCMHEGAAFDTGELAQKLGIEREVAVRAAFGLRRKGWLKRNNWKMLPAVPLGLIEQVVKGGEYATCGC